MDQLRFFLLFDDKQQLVTRFDKAVHGDDAIPAEAVPVDEAIYIRTLVETDGRWCFDQTSGQVTKQPIPELPEAERLAMLRDRTLQQINAQAASELVVLSSSYPDGEVQSWSRQTREAEALLANPDADTPLLNAIAKARGLLTVELARRVIAKTEAFAIASGAIIGKRQALEDAITAVDVNAPGADKALADIRW